MFRKKFITAGKSDENVYDLMTRDSSIVSSVRSTPSKIESTCNLLGSTIGHLNPQHLPNVTFSATHSSPNGDASFQFVGSDWIPDSADSSFSSNPPCMKTGDFNDIDEPILFVVPHSNRRDRALPVASPSFPESVSDSFTSCNDSDNDSITDPVPPPVPPRTYKVTSK